MSRLATRLRDLRWTEVAVPLVGVVLALATILVYGLHEVHFGDARDYMRAAQSLLHHGTYPREASLSFFRPPLYPLLIAAIWWIGPDGSVAAIKLVQAALFGVTCWLLYRIALEVTGNRSLAAAGALLYAINPFALLQTADVQTETFHTTLVAAGVLLVTMTLYRTGRATPAAIGAGLAFGLASLCRPTALPVGLALAACVLVRRDRFVRRFALAAIVVAGMAVAILPWTFCNWRATGEPIVITDGFGYHLWLGNHPAEQRLYEGHFRNRRELNRYSYNYLQRELPEKMIADWERSGGYAALTLSQRERLWRKAALDTMRAKPLLTLRLWADKTWAYWRPWLLPVAYPMKLVVGSGVAVSLLYLFAIAGAGLWYRSPERRPFLIVLAALFASSTIEHAMTHVMIRFRLPYVDPYLSLLAGTALLALATKLPWWPRAVEE